MKLTWNIITFMLFLTNGSMWVKASVTCHDKYGGKCSDGSHCYIQRGKYWWIPEIALCCTSAKEASKVRCHARDY